MAGRSAAHAQARSTADLAAVEAALDRAISRYWPDPDRPVDAAARYALGGGGKRLRPLVCIAASRAVIGDPLPGALYDVAASLEIVHTYSLVHDDLPCMDDDALRRGRPTAHRVFGSAAAMLAGATMIPAAFALLEEGMAALGRSTSRQDAPSALAAAAGGVGMVGGQMLDLEAEGRGMDVVALERVHRRKTGALFAGAARIGAIAAGASDRQREALGAWGAALGLAFQVADDILDEVGSAEVTGKQAGRDRALRKATYPALLGLEGAKQRARATVETGVAALEAAGIHDDELVRLARFAVERDR